jgi:hypothetical protein
MNQCTLKLIPVGTLLRLRLDPTSRSRSIDDVLLRRLHTVSSSVLCVKRHPELTPHIASTGNVTGVSIGVTPLEPILIPMHGLAGD